MKYSYSSDWIHRHEDIYHWTYYWHQVHLIREEIEQGDTILEIGVGTKFTSNYLKSKGFDVITADIDPGKEPDILGNIVEMDLPDDYDYIMAFEVFEHMPYEEFIAVLKKLKQHCRKRMILSVPRNEKVWLQLMIELPGRKKYKFRIATRRKKIIAEHHHWEVDHPPVSKNVLEEGFRSAGFRIKTFKRVNSLYFYALETNH